MRETGEIRIERAHTPEHIARIVHLAATIWPEHYAPFIGHAQVAYMLERFQSSPAIERQLVEGYEYYLALYEDTPVGYFAVQADETQSRLLLSKLYVARAMRGRGVGRIMLESVKKIARRAQCEMIWLTVNKNNSHSIGWYIRMGFKSAGPTVQDIGGGFIMDDYRMELRCDTSGFVA